MEIVFTIVNALIGLGIVLFIKSYLPTYMAKKGENLATKEDIAGITKATEEVTSVFQREMEVFSQELSFSNNYAFDRYSLLYAKIYGIVIQSEYLRFFFSKYQEQDISFEEYPFIELAGKKTTETLKFSDHGSEGDYKKKIESINDVMTSFNKEQLCNFIIEKGEYASPKLLKLAIAYRFTNSKYSAGNQESMLSKSFGHSEYALIKEIVKTIIMEYNEMRKIVKLSYSEQELNTGLIDQTDFK